MRPRSKRSLLQGTVTIALAGVIVVLGVAVAQAEISYRWVTDQELYVVNPGETVDVKVFLEETVTGVDQGLLDPNGGAGMFGLGVGVFWDGDPQPAEPAKVMSVGDIAHNPAFNDSSFTFKEVTDISATLVENQTSFTEGIFGDTVADGVSQLWAGTFTFTAGTKPGEVTSIRVGDNDENNDNTVALDFSALDGRISDGLAQIQSVPEPSSIMLMSIAAICFGGWHVRRRRS